MGLDMHAAIHLPTPPLVTAQQDDANGDRCLPSLLGMCRYALNREWYMVVREGVCQASRHGDVCTDGT